MHEAGIDLCVLTWGAQEHAGAEDGFSCMRAAKLGPVGFGIKKLQITCVIEDAKVESMDAIIEDDLVKCGSAMFSIGFHQDATSCCVSGPPYDLCSACVWRGMNLWWRASALRGE